MAVTCKRPRTSSGLMRAATWHGRALAIYAARKSGTDQAEPDLSRRSAYIYLALLIPVLTILVLANRKWSATVTDTLLLISNFEMLERFSSLFSNANANPLQALFDIFASGLRLDMVPNMIGRLLFGAGMHINFFYIFCGVLLTYAVAAMARAAGMRWGVALLAGIFLPLLIMPITGMAPLAEHFYWLWPITYYAVGGMVLVTALFWQIDGRSWTRAAGLTAVIALVLLHLSMIQILHVILLAPGLAAMGVGALAASESRRELAAKIICAVTAVIALGCAGIFHYLYAIGIDTASHVFYQELMEFMTFQSPDWNQVLDDVGSVIMNPFTYEYKRYANIDGMLAPLSQLGAIYLAIFGATRKARIFGRTVLVWVVATALMIVILRNFYYYTRVMYQGPHPRYFVTILWPYYAICLASLIFAIAERSVALLAGAWSRAGLASKYLPHGLVVILLIGPVVFIVANRTVAAVAADQSVVSCCKRNPIVDYLEREIGVGIDSDFRGSVISMPTIYDRDTNPYAYWRREATFHYLRTSFGNDLGTFGLRYHNIPTFDEETHNITPQFFLIARELLSRPGIDQYEKHFPVVTRVNEPIMALLGLRYIIADYELRAGTPRLAMPLPQEAREILETSRLYKSPVRVYELAHPNLGNYSPTKVVRAETAKATIVEMSRPDFDGREIVVTDASIGDNLIPAAGAAMTVRLGGVALRASSAGESVLVLPVQYSHCWRIVSGEGASLFRANLMQLGVRFSGELRIELRQIFGPFWQSGCRVDDAADVERLRMAEAIGAGTEREKLPGNGINLIPSPEALETSFESNPAASIEDSGQPSDPIREYTVTAEGGGGNHFIGLRVPKLAPGPYTLSMQVRANGTSGVALQLKDEFGDGALAEYLLPARSAWTYRVGRGGDKRGATIRRIDAEWFELTVTSTVMTEAGYVFVHVLNRGKKSDYVPNGEAVVFRAVKLEYGETATPYHPEGGKLPGNGINLIPSPEALDTSFESNPIAFIKAIGKLSNPPREYTMTAQGDHGNHFMGLRVRELTPGPYTLSMEVRANGKSRVALQIRDESGDGALAEYRLPMHNVSTYPVGQSGDRRGATIRKVDSEWFQLTVTSTVKTEMGYVFVHILDSGGKSDYVPNGEAVAFRAVKLEYGETATPYMAVGQ
jgi:hypothetical protein